MTNELILLAGESGYFKVRKDELPHIGDVYVFEICTHDETAKHQVLNARVPKESADMLRRFLNNHLGDDG